MKPGLGVILASLIIILTNLVYLGDPTFPYRIPLILALLFYTIYGLFEYRKYYNQIVYSIILTVFLVVILALTFIQPLSPIVDVMIYRLVTGVSTLMLLGLSLFVLIDWRKKSEAPK